MVTEWILDLLVSFWEWLISSIPWPEPPEWFEQLEDGIGFINDHITGLSAWLPFPLLGTVLTAVFTLLLLSLGLKVARIVASFLTAGGGSAG
jgi:hypothetical protein